MSYLDFFEWCDNGGITEEWLPFDVLFRLPPGAAEFYVGNLPKDDKFFQQTAENFDHHGEVVEIIATFKCVTDDIAGFFRVKRAKSYHFFWGKSCNTSKTIANGTQTPSFLEWAPRRGSNFKVLTLFLGRKFAKLKEQVLKGEIKSPISKWESYKQFTELYSIQ